MKKSIFGSIFFRELIAFRCFLVVFLCTLLIVQGVGYAQRSIDLETEAISPVGSVTNGNTLPLSFKWTIHGPDAWRQGDSIFYALYAVRSGGELDVFYTGILYNRYQDMDSGISAQYADSYTIRFAYENLTAPLTLDFCVTLYSRVNLANGDILQLSYDDPDTTNNTSCRSVTVHPRSTDIQHQFDKDPSWFSFFPNPAYDQLTLTINENIPTASVTLCDLRGRELWRGQYQKGQGSLKLGLSDYSSGLYFLTLEADRKKVTKKLNIR